MVLRKDKEVVFSDFNIQVDVDNDVSALPLRLSSGTVDEPNHTLDLVEVINIDHFIVSPEPSSV